MHFFAVAQHLVNAASKPVSVCLKPVTQSWLHDIFTTLNLLDETMYIGNQVFVHVGNVGRNNCSEQYATQAWGWVDRQKDAA
jgi:hypothetical protein